MNFSSERVKHLEFVQSTIARQASHSFAIKGWAVTASSAVFLYVVQNLSIPLVLVSLLPVIAFGVLDALFLRLERAFRCLYEEVRRPDSMIEPFCMDIGKYIKGWGVGRCSWKSVAASQAWWSLHGAIAVVWITLLLVSIF